MKWFTYDQNNSGGYFIENESVSHLVCIQAETAEQANLKAFEITREYSEFCECCGERWHCNETDADGSDVPSQYEKPLSDSESSSYRDTAILHLANGKKLKIEIGKPFDLTDAV